MMVRWRRCGVFSAVMVCSLLFLGVGGCGMLSGSVGWRSENGVEYFNDGDRVTWNRMNVAWGLGRRPTGRERPKLERYWRNVIPASNADRPFGYLFVNYQRVSFKQMQQSELKRLQAALDEANEVMGVGPWELVDTNGGGCGPRDPNYTTGRRIGSHASFRIGASMEVRDERFFQFLDILDKRYPGLAEQANQRREDDTSDHRYYHIISDGDDYFAVGSRSDWTSISFESGCYITNGT